MNSTIIDANVLNLYMAVNGLFCFGERMVEIRWELREGGWGVRKRVGTERRRMGTEKKSGN